MQLFKGWPYYFGYRDWHNIHEYCVSPASKWSTKNYIYFFQWNVNWYLDDDFNLEVCGIIVFLEVWTGADFLKLWQVN